ncbi:MAG: carbohydrate ABC transporter permease [Ruthenibacterium sp.]
MKRTKLENLAQVIIILLMSLLMLTIVVPIMHIVSVSISTKEAVNAGLVGLFPSGFDLGVYKELLGQNLFQTSMKNTLFLTATVTVLGLSVNFMAAYAFSKKFYGKKIINYIFIFTMYFSGGLIPSYILVTNWLHLRNNYLALILPILVNVFYIIVIRTQIEAVPASLSEAAEMDGATEFQIMTRVVLPTVGPTIAAIGMFIALDAWNMWYSVLLYTDDRSFWTLQYFLRVVIFEKSVAFNPDGLAAIAQGTEQLNPLNFQMAAIVIVALPVVAIYPFVQKYFVKGILAGSVKE